MSTIIQQRGGTTTEHATFIGADREVTVDTTKKTLVVHDGTTAGGTPLAKASDITAINTALTGKQPIDADLTSIAGLAGTTGILKKTAANTWTLDTTVYAPNAHVGTTGTAHGNATTTVAGFMSNTDKTKLDGIAAGAQVNVATNLAIGTRTTTAVPVTSSTGTNVDLPAATTTLAGVMSSADKVKLNGIAAGAQVNVATNLAIGTRTTTAVPVTSSTGTNVDLPAATTTLAGVMSSADKVKLNGIAAGAQVNVATNLGITAGTTGGPIITSSTGTNVTLPIASTGESGVITTGMQIIGGFKNFTTSPVVPTPALSDDSTKVATTAFVKDLVGGSTAVAKSLNTNGYVRFANGLIMQWGYRDTTSNPHTITFPLAFPNACLNVVTANVYPGNTDASITVARTLTKTNFTLYTDHYNVDAYWFATGY
jgi:hypothetical protein